MQFSRKRNASKIKSKWIGCGKTKTKLTGPPERSSHQKPNDTSKLPPDVINTDEEIEVGNFHNFDEELIIPKTKRQCYGVSKEKEFKCWEKHNIDYCSLYSMKFDTLPTYCCFCNGEFSSSFIWCKSCGPLSFYCHDCANKVHQNTLFHSLVEVKVDGSIESFQVKSILQSEHTRKCLSAYSRILTVISETGSSYQCVIYFCKCQEEFNTLIHLDLWPVTPLKPNTVLSINLLHLFVSLQLEGKISFTSFCDGLSWKSGVVDSDLRRHLNRMSQTDSLDQFRHFRRQLTSLKTICGNYDGLGKCASCPKDNGCVFYCLDANFGLVLKASASKSKRLAIRSENLFILDQDVKAFMESYDDSLKTKDCSNFQAGNNLRSKRKTKKLSVTGIFGMSCRHEFPKLFLNMQHGERLGYAVLLLERILKETENKNLNIHIIYDIACVLKSHLQKKKTFNKYQHFKFGIPVFHSYGHKGDCQVKNSIRRLDTFGLMDGELMERLWSYLRSFSKITKEMTPAHRTDLLSDALMHFGSKKMGNIGKYLVFLHHKATETVNSCNTEIESICSKLPVVVNEEIIKTWKIEEDNIVSKNGKALEAAPADWKHSYYLKLKDFYKESALVLMSEKVCDAAMHQRKAKRLERSLTSFEKVHKIAKRWKTTESQFRNQHLSFLQEKSNETASTLYSRCSERLMLLTLKKRYADGSAIATRLSKQINKVCKEIKNLLASYNSMRSEISPKFKPVDYKEALDVKSSIYNEINLVSNLDEARSSQVPINVVKSLVQFYLRKQRAQEEIIIVEEEMRSTLHFWENQLTFLDECASHQTSVGIRYLLRERILIVKNFLGDLKKLFEFATEPVERVEINHTNNHISLNGSENEEYLFSDQDFSSDEEAISSGDSDSDTGDSVLSDDLYI